MVPLSQAKMRHTLHYIGMAGLAELTYLQGKPLEGLILFDRERGQFDVAWAWLLDRDEDKSHTERDALLVQLADATAHTGELRYDTQSERMPQLEAHITAARRLENRRQEGVASGNLGIAHCVLGNLEKAITYHQQHLALAQSIHDQYGEGNALGNLGLAYAELGEIQRAIDLYTQQLVIVREIGDRRGEGNALGNLGLAYAELGEIQRAIDLYTQQLVIVREIGDRRGEGNALGNLGLAYKNMHDYSQAIEYYKQSLAMKQAISDKLGEAIHYWNLGLLYEHQGDLTHAEPLMQAAADFYTSIGHIHYVTMMQEGLTRVRATLGMTSPMESAMIGTVTIQKGSYGQNIGANIGSIIYSNRFLRHQPVG